ncbi:hypothetical protein [Streptomyces sp. JB150]|uniref:hypothetical protein n=1 Tax=Streptomyces sp. JB150 TaxID=2714844 RepID=UPI00140AF2D1|nr:hypothetical protein [Streptomyces sp. JB150]QIJ64865.1 hypothetical protein G7Z13_24710 [Streptomyces sp. JB150]
MGTRTVDETEPTTAEAAAAGDATTAGDSAAAGDAAKGEVTEAQAAAAEAGEGAAEASGEAAAPEGPSGVGQGAGAVVSAALGVVSLTGGWVGTVASARQSLIGQLETSASSSVADMVQAGYGDAWRASALWAGVFALAALIVGAVVLARPAFGVPGRPQASWIKSVAWGGVSLGVLGLLLAVLKYTDVLLGLPSA